MLWKIVIVLILGIGVFIWYRLSRYERIEIPERTLIEKLIVERSGEGEYLLQFNAEGHYTIFTGTHPDSIDWEIPIAETTDSIIRFPQFDRHTRIFFGIRDREGNQNTVSERNIHLEGAYNFRDLGGIPNHESRAIRWGKLFRSGKISGLTRSDRRYIKNLSIRTVVDFRATSEMERDPSSYPDNYAINTVRVPIGDSEGELLRQLKKEIKNADDNFDSEAWVADINRQFVNKLVHQFRPFIELLQNEEVYPLMFHCNGGKDRTGFATMLVLSMLGVDKELIIGDFLMSNYYRHEKVNKMLRKSALLGISQKITLPLVEVRPSYIKAALEAINKKYGSMDAFLLAEYQIDNAQKKHLKRMLLTPATDSYEIAVNT